MSQVSNNLNTLILSLTAISILENKADLGVKILESTVLTNYNLLGKN